MIRKKRKGLRMNDIRLTQYSHGAGCGCKISPKQLDNILQSARENISYPALLVGNASNDDAGASPRPTPSAISTPWAANR